MIPKVYNKLQILREDQSHWWSICPFHDDRHPSFSINKGDNFRFWFRCWACGAQGSTKRFAQLMGQSFVLDNRAINTKHISLKHDIDFSKLDKLYKNNINIGQIEWLSNKLGISRQSLQYLGVGMFGKSFTFPMVDPAGRIIGIRRRFAAGTKVCIRGSRLGLFVPENFGSSEQLLVTEGESDLAAALDLGFNAIGRPGCKAIPEMVKTYCDNHQIEDVVIVADTDTFGQEGANQLKELLVEVVQSVRLITPSKNDLRQWFNTGATKQNVIDLIEQGKVFKRPNIVCRCVPHRMHKGPFKPITTTLGVVS